MPQEKKAANTAKKKSPPVKLDVPVKKRPAKKTGSRGSAGAGKKRASQKKRKKQKSSWWAWPVTLIMLVVLGGVGLTVSKEIRNYEEFKVMRETVSFEGFYPGIVIDGVDVSGRSLNEVLVSLREHEESLRQQVNVTLACGSQVWKVTPDDLDYHTNYESVVRDAFQLGRVGTVREKYEAIRKMDQTGTVFTIDRGCDVSLLKIITDDIASGLSKEMQNARVADFDVDTLSFTFTDASEGYYVDADQLYQSALSAIQSGVGGQTIVISQKTLTPTVTRGELEGTFGQITETRTSTSGSNDNRLNNIELALASLNGVCVSPGETFSFNATVGQRTKERGYRSAGAFVDGLLAEEVGGGICQVSTTLFNAVAKANLTITARQPHSRMVQYVDEGKDAAVSWPSQDFKFTNNTEYPVYIVAGLNETGNRCIISIYGQLLPNGMSIVIESEVTEKLEPGEDKYNYTTSLPTGVKKLVEAAREGCKAVAYKIYLDRNGNEIKREILCRSTYAASGAVYRVGQ